MRKKQSAFILLSLTIKIMETNSRLSTVLKTLQLAPYSLDSQYVPLKGPTQVQE